MYDIYIKKLTPQELGYRKGQLTTGGYFYISKAAVGTFFEKLSDTTHNDSLQLDFNDPFKEGEIINASYIYHNDLYALENGTRNEYRIYLNREIAKHELHFRPEDIIVFLKDGNTFSIKHYKKSIELYETLDRIINDSRIRGYHAVLKYIEYINYIS
jgi:hypothetical protein